MRVCCAAYAVLALLPFAAHSQEVEEGIQLSYGLGLVGTSGVYVGEGDRLIPLPVLALTYGKLTIDLAKGLEYNVWSSDQTTVSASLQSTGSPDFPETELFAGLKRDDWIGAEVSLSHEFGAFEANVSYHMDISNTHDGSTTEVSLGRSFVFDGAIITAHVGATYLDSDASGYLFGVAPGEATAARTAYTPRSIWKPHIEFTALRPLSDRLSISAFFRHEMFPDRISDSPLVDAEERTTIGVNFVRQF